MMSSDESAPITEEDFLPDALVDVVLNMPRKVVRHFKNVPVRRRPAHQGSSPTTSAPIKITMDVDDGEPS